MIDSRELAALRWFGYGQWSAAFWFIGMEPGGREQDASYDSWLRLGGGELIDCKQHHLDSGFERWHGGVRPPTQATWRGLIKILLSFENHATDIESVRTFQQHSFGSAHGNNAVIELSALHARSVRDDVDRDFHRQARISLIRARLDIYEPKVVLFYGLSYREHYERLTEVAFGEDRTCWRGKTLCVLAPHPTARSRAASNYSVDLGVALRLQLEASNKVAEGA